MIICVGEHENDHAAEQAARNAGFATQGVGGSSGPPEPGVYYFPVVGGLPTGWVRVWSREKEDDPYRWTGLDPKSLVDAQRLEGLTLAEVLDEARKQADSVLALFLNNGGINQLVAQLLPYLLSQLKIQDIDYNPNRGPIIGQQAGRRLRAEYVGQMVRQWLNNQNLVYLWVARGTQDETSWVRVGGF